MPVNPETTVRKLFSMPRSMAERVEAFRRERNLGSDAEALRQLVEAGLLAVEPVEALKDRCAAALAEGHSFGWVITNLLEPHPRVFAITLNSDKLVVGLKDDVFIQYDRKTGQWETI